MCWKMFGCCETPTDATIKGYDNTTPWGLDWSRLKTEASAREVAIALGSSLLYTAGSGTGGTLEGALISRSPSNGALVESSVSTPLSAPPAVAGDVTLLTDASSVIWWAEATGTFAPFNTSLVQQATISKTLSISCGMRGSDFIIGRRVNTGAILEKYDASGTLIDSLSETDLSIAPGLNFVHASLDRAVSTSILLYGFDLTNALTLWEIDADTFTELNATIVAAPLGAGPYHHSFSDIGKGERVRNGKVLAAIGATQSALVLLDIASLSEDWRSTGSLTNQQFVAIGDDHVYVGNRTTDVVSALDIADGSVAWTIDLTTSLDLAAGTWGRMLSGGYLAIFGQTAAAIIDTSSGSLITDIDSNVSDMLENGAHYITVGASRAVSP